MRDADLGEGLALGIKSLDEKRKRFLESLNAFFDAQERTGQACLAESVVGWLKAFAAEHFHVEEGYMQVFGYPEYESHLKEHEGFMETVCRFEDACVQSGGDSREILDYMQGWVKQHLLGVDRQMGRYLAEHLR